MRLPDRGPTGWSSRPTRRPATGGSAGRPRRWPGCATARRRPRWTRALAPDLPGPRDRGRLGRRAGGLERRRARPAQRPHAGPTRRATRTTTGGRTGRGSTGRWRPSVTTSDTVPGRVFSGLAHLARVRAGLPQLHASASSHVVPDSDDGILADRPAPPERGLRRALQRDPGGANLPARPAPPPRRHPPVRRPVRPPPDRRRRRHPAAPAVRRVVGGRSPGLTCSVIRTVLKATFRMTSEVRRWLLRRARRTRGAGPCGSSRVPRTAHRCGQGEQAVPDHPALGREPGALLDLEEAQGEQAVDAAPGAGLADHPVRRQLGQLHLRPDPDLGDVAPVLAGVRLAFVDVDDRAQRRRPERPVARLGEERKRSAGGCGRSMVTVNVLNGSPRLAGQRLVGLEVAGPGQRGDLVGQRRRASPEVRSQPDAERAASRARTACRTTAGRGRGASRRPARSATSRG